MFAQRGDRGSDHEHKFSRINEDSSREVVPGSDGISHQGVTCFGCQFLGHYRNQCPCSSRTGYVSTHEGALCAQRKAFYIPLRWILLDTCSTFDASNNPVLVKYIRTCSLEDRLTAHANRGEKFYNLIANLKMLPVKFHFKKSSMATILSFKLLAKFHEQGSAWTQQLAHVSRSF